MSKDRRDGPPDVSFDFGHEAGAPRQARRALQPLLADKAARIVDAIQLAASELVSNVVQHTSSGGSMRAWDHRASIPLRIEVEDFEPTTPSPRDASDDSGGRGLRLVDGVADLWGVERTAAGKVVWAEFHQPPPAQGGG